MKIKSYFLKTLPILFLLFLLFRVNPIFPQEIWTTLITGFELDFGKEDDSSLFVENATGSSLFLGADLLIKTEPGASFLFGLDVYRPAIGIGVGLIHKFNNGIYVGGLLNYFCNLYNLNKLDEWSSNTTFFYDVFKPAIRIVTGYKLFDLGLIGLNVSYIIPKGMEMSFTLGWSINMY